MVKAKYILGFICILFLLILFFPPMNGFLSKRTSTKVEIINRKKALCEWKKMVDEYRKSTESFPDNLHVLVSEVVELPYLEIGEIYNGDLEKYLLKPEVFFEEIQYKYFKNESAWLIVESSGGQYIEGRYMIDHNGQIYLISKTEENFHKKLNKDEP